MLILLFLCTLLQSLTLPTVMSSESPSFYPSLNVPTTISPSVDFSYFPTLPDEYLLTVNFTQFIPGIDIQDVHRNQQLFRLVFLDALKEAVVTICRANVKCDFQQYSFDQSVIPSFINTSIPTQNISRRLQNSELTLYVEETRQLQTNSSSLEQCLIKYIKIVQVVTQITVPLPKNVTAADYALILENLLQNPEYIKLINKWAIYYDVPMLSLDVSTKICGYVTLKSEPSILPTILPSSMAPSIAPAVAPTFLPSAFPTNNPFEVPSLAPALPPTLAPTAEPTTVAPTSLTPTTSTPSLIPSSATPTQGSTQTSIIVNESVNGTIEN